MNRILRALRRALRPLATVYRRAARMLRRTRHPMAARAALTPPRQSPVAATTSATVRWLLVWITHRRPPLPAPAAAVRTGQRPGHPAHRAIPMRT
jgi:hypothetical protein